MYMLLNHPQSTGTTPAAYDPLRLNQQDGQGDMHTGVQVILVGLLYLAVFKRDKQST